jgi:Transposase, Mutator family
VICTGKRDRHGDGFSNRNRQRDRFSGWAAYERRRGKRRDYRNGYYERDFVTRFGTIRLRIARTRAQSFLPVGLKRFQRRAEEVSLIREAFLRGISTRQVGRVVATITGETVSAQTVSKLTRDLDQALRSHVKSDWIRAKAPAIQYVLWLRTKTNWVRRSLHDYCRV